MALPKPKAGQSTTEDGGPNDIILAAKRGDARMAAMILASRPDAIYDTDINGFTALHYACFHSDLILVKLLLAAPGVNCRAKDKWGRWPLHYSYPSPFHELKQLIRAATFPRRPDLDVVS